MELEGHQNKSFSGGFHPALRAQVGLSLAGLGAALTIFPFGRPAAIFGLVIIAGGTIISSSFERKSHTWWALLVAGTVLALAAPLIAITAQTLGGFAAVVGGILILISVALALPVHNQAP